MTAIVIEVDEKVAQTFSQVSADRKLKLQLLLKLRLQELMSTPERSLIEIMDEIGHYSEAQGMTQELLVSLLNEK
jgi:hypothetical protein